MCAAIHWLKEKVMSIRARLLLRLRPNKAKTNQSPNRACPTTTSESDYEFQHRRDSIGLGHNNRTGVEL